MANERINPIGMDGYSKAEIDAKLTGSALLGELLKVDGTGSGLDADLLDGKDASAYAAASHTHALPTSNNADHAWITLFPNSQNDLKSVDIGVNSANGNLFTHLYYTDGRVIYYEYQHK